MGSRLRYAAVPLITVDPYLNIWSMSDKLYEDTTRHWTERSNSMGGFVCADGKWYRFMGSLKTYKWRCLKDLRIIPQTSCEVFATKTVYDFENDIFKLKVTFRTPLLLDDPLLLSRPVSYISYHLEYKDDKEHDTRVYFEISSECCVDDVTDYIELGYTDISAYCGRGDKETLNKAGDDVLINWGFLHLIAPDAECKIYDEFDRVEIFHWAKDREGISGRRRVIDGYPVLSAIKLFGKAKAADGFVCVAYDDIYSIEYFEEKLKGYWTANGDSFEAVLKKAVAEYGDINTKCDKFDKELSARAIAISDKYADIVCLAYRQVIASHKLVIKDGRPLFFSKECGSNGCIGTVDITYPSMPMFLMYAPALVKAMLDPVFYLAEGEHGWEYEFAPHDVGQYPKANGQVYGYDSETNAISADMQMPVEECGNMLLCTAAVCKTQKDFSYAKEHYGILKRWADYLVNAGYDPENQLCTDDFAGHLAHNCNLSIKGILGIAAFTYISEMLGKNADCYYKKAKEYAEMWQASAFDGDRYKLAFDKPGTWSIKYNLIWDRYFNFKLFNKKVAETEIEFYKTKINKYGLPIDSREGYTKSDWQMWAACLTDDKEFLDAIINAMWRFINDTEDRIPFTDFYQTQTPDAEGWFRNRTVQGGLFMPMLIG